MRIATSTIFDNQTTAIDNLTFQQQQLGAQISSGKSLNEPSDNPTQIAQDLSVRSTIASENTTGQSVSNFVSQLTSTDSALGNMTNILQSARQLAIQGGDQTLSQSQRQAIAGQVAQLLNESIGIANTNYAGHYVFSGASTLTSAPLQAQGSPTSSVSLTGNFQQQTQVFQSGQTFVTSTSMQEAFNFQSTDGTPDAFTVLQTLRDTLNK